MVTGEESFFHFPSSLLLDQDDPCEQISEPSMADAKEESDDRRITSQLAPSMMEVESQKSPSNQRTETSTDPLDPPLFHEP
jgi:hypothetical protein